MHILYILPTKQRLDRPCFDGPFFPLIKHCISFRFVVLSLVLSRNSQLHTACYKRRVFLYLKYLVDEWFKKNYIYYQVFIVFFYLSFSLYFSFIFVQLGTTYLERFPVAF